MKLALLFAALAILGCHSLLGQVASAPNSQSVAAALLTNGVSSSTNASGASKRDDIIKLMKVTRSEEQMKALFSQMLAQFKKAMPDVIESEWRQLETEANPQEMIALAVPIYQKHLTHEEVKGLISFYETPLGQKSLDRMALITSELFQAGQEWGQRFALRLQKTNVVSSARSTRTGRLTDAEKEEYLRLKGYDPTKYEFDYNLDIVRKPFQSDVKEVPSTMTPPPGARYMISVETATGTETYFSKNEPKPFGPGYKIDLGQVQVTVSGNVRIVQFKKD